ncbi:unnamed protein product [Ectocarpus sp. 12 AP-2014]
MFGCGHCATKKMARGLVTIVIAHTWYIAQRLCGPTLSAWGKRGGRTLLYRSLECNRYRNGCRQLVNVYSTASNEKKRRGRLTFARVWHEGHREDMGVPTRIAANDRMWKKTRRPQIHSGARHRAHA